VNQRVLGFVLVSAAVVGSILAFTFADGYEARRPITWNLANAALFSTYRSAMVSRPCPRPVPGFFAETDPSVPRGCPDTVARYLATPSPTFQGPGRVRVFSLNLGTGMAILVAMGLTGVGMITFGRR
jgi:hypothetical protein